MTHGAERTEVLVFDVNETLLDLHTLAPLFAEYLGDPGLLKQWFQQMLLYSQTVTLAGNYADFSKLAHAALEMTAAMHGREVSAQASRAIFEALRMVPAHTEVPGALDRLRAAGFRTAALTNSTQSSVSEQLKNNGLSESFEKILSVDAWQKFKPHPEVYRQAAAALGVDVQQIRMIAAHPWDLMGAQAAGCRVAFVERKAGSWFPIVPKPAIAGPTLREVADQLLA